METSPPLFSTFTLFTEIIITIIIFFIFYKGYTENRFFKRLTIITLSYEILFKISYMTYRAVWHETKIAAHAHTPFHIAVAAFHGIFSITMFIALVVFLVLAMKNYSKGINYFKEHSVITGIFLVLWSMAILSGLLFYYLAYFTNT